MINLHKDISHQCYTLYSHSFVINLSQPSHSSAFSLYFPISLQYYNDNIDSICVAKFFNKNFKQLYARSTVFLSFTISCLHKMQSFSTKPVSIMSLFGILYVIGIKNENILYLYFKVWYLSTVFPSKCWLL